MKILTFSSRNTKEILRDPLNLCFGLGFPLVLLILLSIIQSNIPADIFRIESLAPGIAVFGLSFISLFSGMLISKDRCTAFLTRLFSSPLTSTDYIVGYTLPLLPMCIMQSILCFLTSSFLGLNLNLNILLILIVLIPVDILFISIGLLAGSVFNDKQVGGICGALLTNLCAWLSGIWFDLNLIGGTFQSIANTLPFVHCVEASRAALNGNYNDILPHLIWVIIYDIVILMFAIRIFNNKMKNNKI